MKVKVQGKHEFLSNSYDGKSSDTSVSVNFSANYSDPANAEWAKYTPSVEFKATMKKEVADKLEIGQPFTVTFTPDN